MGDPVSPSLVQAFYEAYAKRDLAAVADFLSDDIDWLFLGPVEIFPFCGHWRGKQAVIEHFSRRMPTLFSLRRMEPDDLVIDGQRAASFSMITAVETGSGRILKFHCAHLVTFRGGKVVSIYAVADTFGVIEQLQGVEVVIGPSAAIERLCELVPV
jgi:ketosteroid isomerase-like protein